MLFALFASSLKNKFHNGHCAPHQIAWQIHSFFTIPCKYLSRQNMMWWPTLVILKGQVFKDISFMTLTDTLPSVFHGRWRLYCSTWLHVSFVQGQDPQEQQQNGILSGITEAPDEIQICGRFWWNQNQLMEVRSCTGEVQDVLSVLLTFM